MQAPEMHEKEKKEEKNRFGRIIYKVFIIGFILFTLVMFFLRQDPMKNSKKV
jgi:hypothetical protein